MTGNKLYYTRCYYNTERYKDNLESVSNMRLPTRIPNTESAQFLANMQTSLDVLHEEIEAMQGLVLKIVDKVGLND